MANIKNYGIAGVGSDVQFGKKGGRLVFSEGAFSFFNDDGGNIILSGVASPSADTDAVNKGYVDSVAQGLDFKDSVKYATVIGEVVDLVGGTTLTMDGQTLVGDERVLVKNQSVNTENGIYTVVMGGPWIRTEDADEDGEISGGSYVFVEEGTVNGFSSFVQTEPGDVAAGGPQSWTLFSKAGEVIAGQGLTLNGDTLNLDLVELPNAAGAALVNPNIVLGSDEKASFSVLMSNNTDLFVQSFGPAGNVRTGLVAPAAGDYSAVMVTYDPTNSSIVAPDVQVAIEALDDLVSGLGTQVGDNIDAIAALDGRVTTNEGDIAALELADTALQGEIDDLEGVVAALAAVDIDYSNATSLLLSTNVQGAIDELDGRIDVLSEATVNAVNVIFDPLPNGMTATNVQDAIEEVETRVDANASAITALQAADTLMQGDIAALELTVGEHTADITALETTVSGHTTDIADLEFTVSGHTLQLSGLNTRLDGVDASIANLVLADEGFDTRLDALEAVDTNVDGDLATLAAFAALPGVGTAVQYTQAVLNDDPTPNTAASLTVDLDYSRLAPFTAPFVGDEVVALSTAAGFVTATVQDLKDFAVGDLSSNTIGAFDSSVTVTDADDTNTVPGSIDFVVDTVAVASASATAFDVSVAFTGTDATFSGNVGAVDGTFSGNVGAVDGTFTGNVGAVDGDFSGVVTSPEFAGHLTGNVTGNVSGSIAGGSVSGDTGNFTGGVMAASFTGPLNGNATTATAWAAPMTMNVETLVGATQLGSVSFDGGATPVILALNMAAVTGEFITVDEANTAFVNADGNDTMNGVLTADGFVGPLTGDVEGNIDGATGIFSGAVIAASVDADSVDAGALNFAADTVTTAGDVIFALQADKLVRVTDGVVYDTSLGLAGSENGLVTKSFMDAAIATAVTGGTSGGVYTRMATITLMDGTYPIGEALPANSIVMSVRVNITGVEALATLAVGTFMSVDENDPSEAGVYVAESMAAGSGVINAVVAGAPAGVGTADVMIQYRVG